MSRNQSSQSNPVANSKGSYGGTRKAIDEHNVSTMSNILGKEDFSKFAEEAYANESGYAIRYNPYTGEKEMFVAGTRDLGQWALNAKEGVDEQRYEMMDKKLAGMGLPPFMRKYVNKDPKNGLVYQQTRGAYEKELAEVAAREGVDIVYGHSRGAAFVSDAQFSSDTRVVSLDGAMMLAREKKTWNLNEGGTGFTGNFDRMIGYSGEENQSLDLGSHIHHVWD
jgi:hypothetical protein